MDKKTKAALLVAIEKHLGKHGAKDWQKVKDRFSDVPDSTFWRLVKQVREAPASPEALTSARKRISARKRATKAPSEPKATPSPATVAKHGDDAFRGFDYLAEVGSLYKDAKMLRDYSVNAEGKIRIPVYFEKSIARRENILDTAASLMERFLTIETTDSYWRIILEEIGAADKDTQIKILKRLGAIQKNLGVLLPSLASF